MNIIKNSFRSFIWNLMGAMLGFIFQVYSAKVLGAKIYGEANYYLGYAATITIFTCFGLQTFLPKYLHQYKDKENIFSDVFWTCTMLYAIAIPIIWFMLKNEINLCALILILIVAYLSIVAELFTAYYIGIGKTQIAMFKRRFLYSLINIILLLLMLILALTKYYYYILCIILSYIAILTPFLLKHLKKIHINLSFVFKSMNFYIIQIVYGVYFSYSKVLQKSFGTFESVAVLSISITLSSLIAMLGDNFAKVSMSEFAKAWEKRDIKQLGEIYKTTTRINCYLVLPIAMCAILNSKKILEFLGKGYLGGEVILSLMLFSQFINSFTGPNGTILTMTKYSNYEIFNGIVKLISSVIMVALLNKKYVWTIAFSLAMSEVLVNILKTFQLKLKFNIYPYSFKNLIYILIIGVGEFVFFCFTKNIKNFYLWGLGNGVAILSFCYISFKFSTEQEDKVFIQNLKSKFIRKAY